MGRASTGPPSVPTIEGMGNVVPLYSDRIITHSWNE